MCLKQLWGILSLWPERWCLQGSGIIVGFTASDYLNFFYLSLASLCSSVVPNTAPKSSISILKFLINDVYYGRLNHQPCLPRPPHPWWPPIPLWPHQPRPHPPIACIWFACSVRSTGGFPVTVVPAIASRVRWGRLCLWSHWCLTFFWIMLGLQSYPCSTWDITPCVCR